MDPTSAIGHLAQLAWSQLWQVTLLILVVALVVSTCCRQRPHAAYLLWMLVLLKCVTPPLWGSPTGVFSWSKADWQEIAATTAVNPSDVSSSPPTTDEPSVDPSISLDHQPHQQPIQPSPTLPRTPAPVPTTTLKGLSAFEMAKEGKQADQQYKRDPLQMAMVASLFCWGLGSFVWMLLIAIKIRRRSRLIETTTVLPNETTEQMFDRLAKKLGIRRQVRLLITESSAGPAVFGFWKPTVLLPKSMLEGRAADHLANVLAHELIHVRRGDTLIGFLQMFVQIIWWFHPLVWWSNRRMTRERERCCDEEVLAGLNVEPSSYAQSLLEVLKRKRQLKPVFGLLGVRALEITTKRLEHIMQLDRRFHRRTPKLYWLVLVAGLFVVLPGAGITLVANQRETVGQSKQPGQKKPTQTQGKQKRSAQKQLISDNQGFNKKSSGNAAQQGQIRNSTTNFGQSRQRGQSAQQGNQTAKGKQRDPKAPAKA